MKNKKSWIISLAKELVWDTVFIMLVYISFYFLITVIVSDDTAFIIEPPVSAFLFIAAVVSRILFKLFARIVLLRLPLSKLYRLPCIDSKGVIINQQNSIGFMSDNIHREWVLFKTIDGQEIKAYSAAREGIFLGIGTISKSREERPFKTWDSGTLYYRKGNKYNYFEEFIPGSYISEE